jgi:hypothetical protein
MAAVQTKPTTPAGAQELGDESFMSATDLRAYMTEMDMANASKEIDRMDRAEKARKELIKSLSTPVDAERLQEVRASLLHKLRSAAQRGASELMVMRFPCSLCTDKGRSINNADKDWPETLTGRPRQAYEFWRDQLRPAGYRLKAMIVEWPGGLPGDVGFFLQWGDAKR